jgi:Integrase core domain
MVITTTPNKSFEVIALDTVGPLSRTAKNNRYALTIQDELTKYVVIIPIQDKEASTLAKAFVESFILTFGTVKCIKTDQGTEYMNSVFQNVSKLLQIEHLTATAYHPQTIGSLERNHKVLNEFLREYVNEEKDNWDEFVKFYEFAYNTTPHTIHNYTPFELVFARQAFLPIDMRNDRIDPVYNIEDYANEARFKLQKAFKRAKDLLKKAKENTKLTYDKSAEYSKIKIGDKVALENMNRRKLDKPYISNYIIEEIEYPNSIIRNLDNNKITKVHNNRLKVL